MEQNAAGFAERIARCWSKESASTFDPLNPAKGQCSVTALVAQDVLGGLIAKTNVAGAWHYYNIIGGNRYDFTASQFGCDVHYDDIVCGRDDAFTDTTRPQYEALSRTYESGN